MAGRPIGAETKNKRFKAALIRYADASPEKLDELATKLWSMALEGDVVAMREIADRLDGKPAQAIVGDDEHQPIQHVVSWKSSSTSSTTNLGSSSSNSMSEKPDGLSS